MPFARHASATLPNITSAMTNRRWRCAVQPSWRPLEGTGSNAGASRMAAAATPAVANTGGAGSVIAESMPIRSDVGQRVEGGFVVRGVVETGSTGFGKGVRQRLPSLGGDAFPDK